MCKTIAIYCRVSSRKQKLGSQVADLRRWAAAQDARVVWYREQGVSGLTMDRPQWNLLHEAICNGVIATLVVWRLDRLGRTASGLTKLFDELRERNVNLVSLKDGLDLATASGRLMAGVLASIAQFESELKGERIAAGMAASGKRWARPRAGMRLKATPAKVRTIKTLYDQGRPVAEIAGVVELTRPTIYSVLKELGVAKS